MLFVSLVAMMVRERQVVSDIYLNNEHVVYII